MLNTDDEIIIIHNYLTDNYAIVNEFKMTKDEIEARLKPRQITKLAHWLPPILIFETPQKRYYLFTLEQMNNDIYQPYLKPLQTKYQNVQWSGIPNYDFIQTIKQIEQQTFNKDDNNSNYYDLSATVFSKFFNQNRDTIMGNSQYNFLSINPEKQSAFIQVIPVLQNTRYHLTTYEITHDGQTGTYQTNIPITKNYLIQNFLRTVVNMNENPAPNNQYIQSILKSTDKTESIFLTIFISLSLIFMISVPLGLFIWFIKFMIVGH